MSGYQQRRPAPGKQPLPARLADYRTVGDRIDAFCADYPGETCITTATVEAPAQDWIAFRAIVSRRMTDGTEWVLGTGHAAQKFSGQEDQYEKLETAARGRALVAAGYTSSLEKAAEIEAAAEKVNRQEGRELHPFTDAADTDGFIPHEWRGRLDFDSADPNANRPKGQEVPATPHQTPQDAPGPLTEAQQQVIAQAWDMGETKTAYPAVINHLRPLQADATPDQWTAIKRALAAIKAQHYQQAEE